MKVSIITPAYNCEKEIIHTYKSIIKQTYSNFEWIVTDDASTDKTREILKEISKGDSRVIILENKENSGAAIARNKSISYSSGEFIAFIDSDDLWDANKLKKQVEFMVKYDIDFSFTPYQLISESGRPLGKKVDSHIKESVSYEDMLRKKATMGCSTVILRRSAFSDISMPLIRTGQDYALWLKLLKSGTKAYIFPQVLTKYRILPNSISRNKFKKSLRQWEIYRKVERLPLRVSIECFMFYAFRAVFRK
ncbi:TPA: glycosyltransferase family 2 protein [Vibrio parahaemolyticus]